MGGVKYTLRVVLQQVPLVYHVFLLHLTLFVFFLYFLQKYLIL